MDKLAQKRSLRSKIWENVNLTGRALERLHPEFKAVMQNMRSTDKEVRKTVDDIKPIIRAARSSVRRRDYLQAAVNVAAFHQRLRQAIYLLDKFVKNTEVTHYNYLLNQFNERNKEQLFGYDPNEEIKEACQVFAQLSKEAGAYDWLKDKYHNISDLLSDTVSNITTTKGRARRLLEKRFDVSFLRQLKDMTIGIVEESSDLMRELLSLLNNMESGVSRRNPNLYIDKAKELISLFNKYHKSYLKYDNKVVAPLRTHQDNLNKAEADRLAQEKAEQAAREEQARAAAEAKEIAEIEEAKKSPFVTPYVEPQSEPEEVYKEPSFEAWKEQQVKPEEVAEIDQKLEDLRKNKEEPKVQNDNAGSGKKPLPLQVKPQEEEAPQSKAAYSQFLNQLSVYADNSDAASMIKEIVDYSQVIEETDPNSSSRLLLVAAKLASNYKSGGLFDFLKRDKAVQEPTKDVEVKKELSPTKKTKPAELIEDEESVYQTKPLDLPDGRIDAAYTDIPVLSGISSSNIRITMDTARMIINSFIHRLSNVKGIGDIKEYVPSIEKHLIPQLKEAIYNGWVISSASVDDQFNSQDKYIEFYTRLNLPSIDPKLTGFAKLYIICRISAKNKTLTVKNIKRQFAIEGIKPKSPPKEPIKEMLDEDEEESGFDQDLDDLDYPEE